MPTARPCQTCDGKRRHASLLRKPQVRLDLGGTTTGHRHRRAHAVEPELHQPRGTNLNIVHVFQIDQIAAMNANKALGAQATLERRDRLIDQVRSLGADGVAKIGARLKVADVCGVTAAAGRWKKHAPASGWLWSAPAMLGCMAWQAPCWNLPRIIRTLPWRSCPD